MRAASRALSPDSTSSTARTLRCLEYPFAIACPRMLPLETPNLICESEGIPCDPSDSRQLETALAVVGSWRDTLDDAEVLSLLRLFNRTGEERRPD